MDWFEIVAGICSIAGLFVSIFTLIATKSTKRQLDNYRFQVDIEDQLNELNGIKASLFKDEQSWSLSSVQTCQMDAKRIAELYADKISPDLSNTLNEFVGKLIEWKRSNQKEELNEDLKDLLLTVTIKIEKELSDYARSTR